ncbi:MAG: single-stranded DNA-binding protein [Planctomycetes bacterium]|nr:single-stranded DNA-binding protein [Planctomycetota bacterium]
MANLNKVMLIGRLTRDPEVRVFANGGKVAKFGFAVNNRRKNASTGQWEDEPVWLDIEAFNRGDFGKQADTVEQYYRKGNQLFIEGHLVYEQWTGQDGQKRNKLKIVADYMQMVDTRGNGEGGAPRSAPAPARRTSAPPQDESFDHGEPPPMESAPVAARSEEEIPF